MSIHVKVDHDDKSERSHISTWITPRTKDFAGTKWLGKYQVQASRFMAQVIVIINAMISNDWKNGIMEESKESQYKYCLIIKNRDILKGVGVNVSLIIIYLKPYATNNKKKSTS